MQRSIKLLTSALTVCLSTQALAEQGSAQIEIIDQCQAQLEKTDTLILFGGDINRLTGWSHAEKIDGLKLPAKNYFADTYTDASCDNAQVYQNIWVKKYANWDMQHVNGIEPKLAAEELKLKNIESLVLELKVNTAQTSIPTDQEIAEHYAHILTPQQLEQLDSQQINLGLTLFEQGANDQSSVSFNANYFLELDPQQHVDQWLRITIAAENLNYYTEQNWSATAVVADDFAETFIEGLRINPETQLGKVVRHYIADSFEQQAPKEAFKEMDVAFKSIYFTLK